MFGCGGKSSLISESVVEIQINIHHVKEKLDNMTYTQSLGPYVRLPLAKGVFIYSFLLFFISFRKIQKLDGSKSEKL
jgi:hypothetical protein